MKCSIKKLATGVLSLVLATALSVTLLPEAASAALSDAGKKAAEADYDPNGTYHAYFGFQQTQSWIYRDEWYNDSTGKDGTTYEGTDVTFDGMIQSQSDGPINVDGTITDVEIAGNGIYTVGVEGLNGILTQTNDGEVSMIYVDTDIPMSALDEGFTISDWSLTLDGKSVSLREEVFIPAEYTAASGLIRFDAVNSYQKDKGEYPESPIVTAPQDSILITFTVSDTGNKTKNQKKDAVSDDHSTTSSAATTKTTVGGVTYELNKKGTKATATKVKNKKKVVIKNTVKIQDKKVKVTAIKTGAFKNCTNLKSVTIGKYVKQIPQNTFKNCKSLNKLTIKGKLNKVQILRL